MDQNKDEVTEEAPLDAEQAARIERERAELLSVVAAAQPDTLQHKVAWVLNNYPETRNSDIGLQLRYWETFCPEDYDGHSIEPADLYRLPRLTSLSRARARIQNTLRLFLADPSVRRQRHTLSEDERAESSDARRDSAPVYVVYADESGKTQPNLVVGSLWILQGPETYRITVKLDEWRESSGFRGELHFAEVTDKVLPYYKQAIDIVVDSASAMSLKYVAVPREGAGKPQDVVPKLLYHLLVRGVIHEDSTGRAPLPRNLQVWKDAEERGYDALVLAELKDRLVSAASAQFGGRLMIDVVEAADSKDNNLLQVADLFVASLNRFLNPPDRAGKAGNPKDDLAGYVLKRTAVSLEAAAGETYDDLAVRILL